MPQHRSVKRLHRIKTSFELGAAEWCAIVHFLRRKRSPLHYCSKSAVQTPHASERSLYPKHANSDAIVLFLTLLSLSLSLSLSPPIVFLQQGLRSLPVQQAGQKSAGQGDKETLETGGRIFRREPTVRTGLWPGITGLCIYELKNTFRTVTGFKSAHVCFLPLLAWYAICDDDDAIRINL